MATSNRTFRWAGSMFAGMVAIFACLVVSAAWADNGQPQFLSESELIRGRQGTEYQMYKCVAVCPTVEKNVCLNLSPPKYCANDGSNAGWACGYHTDQISTSRICQEDDAGTYYYCNIDKATKCYHEAWCFCKKQRDGSYSCVYTGETHVWTYKVNCANSTCGNDNVFCVYDQ
jgi:hypothetical protein